MNANTLNTYIIKLAQSRQNTFTHKDVVAEFAVDGDTASRMIQDYLRVQASPDGDKLAKVIYRAPGTRTVNTVWRLGERSADVDRIVFQTANDLANRVEILAGSVDQIGKRNPAAKRKINAAMEKFVGAQQALLETIAAACK